MFSNLAKGISSKAAFSFRNNKSLFTSNSIFNFSAHNQKTLKVLNVFHTQASAPGCNPLVKQMEHRLGEKIDFTQVHSQEEYDQLPESVKYSFDVIAPCLNVPLTISVLNDQVPKNKDLKWVQSLLAGVDWVQNCKPLQDSDIPVTNAKGAFSQSLGEFVSLGMLFSTKKVQTFLDKKKAKIWEKENVDMVGDKTMLIVGYGDIGVACAKVAKFGYGTRVIGLKRRPLLASQEAKDCADEIVGLDQLDEWLPHADFVVGILPGSQDNNDFFNMENVFSKMKPSSVFMNIGRGTCVNEEDLVEALQSKTIAGGVLDVYKVEPLDEKSELWNQSNLLMYPHCADLDNDYFARTWVMFDENVDNFFEGKPLTNVTDKHLGY